MASDTESLEYPTFGTTRGTTIFDSDESTRVRIAGFKHPWIAGAGLSLAFLILGQALILERHPDGSSRWLELSPDTYEYVAMIEGKGATAPFKHRLLVPFLASLLPLPPLEALRAITWASLLIGYTVLFVFLRRLQIPTTAAVIAMLAVFASTRNLLLIQNPFITDAFSLMTLTLMLSSLAADRPGRFGVFAVLGVMAREDCLFAAPAFLTTKRWRAGLTITGLTLLVFLVPRVLAPDQAYQPPDFRQLLSWQYYAQVYLAFGFLWFAAISGLIFGRLRMPRGFYFLTLLLLGGSCLSTLFAGDTVRMFLPLLPIMAVFWAGLFQRLARYRVHLALWLVVIVTAPVLALPNEVLPVPTEGLQDLEDWYRRFKWPILAHQVAGLALVVKTAYLLSQPGSGRPDHPSLSAPRRP